jgi:hypothetical protein
MFRSFMKGLSAAVGPNDPHIHIIVIYFAEDSESDEANRAAVEEVLQFYQDGHGISFT